MLTIDTAGTRAQIVTALNGLAVAVNGQPVALTATPEQPPTINPYAVWPVWINARPQTTCLCEVDWHVLLAVPGGDQASQVSAGDQLVSAVADALNPFAEITAIRPARLLVGTSPDVSVPVIQYEITI